MDRSDFRKNSFGRICRFHKDGPLRASDVPKAGQRFVRSKDRAVSRCQAQTKKRLGLNVAPLPRFEHRKPVKVCGRAR